MYVHFFKRVFDILIGLCALPFVLLLIIIFGPIIWFQDKGPIFYAGKRIGLNGKPFGMIKFRSMRVNAPDIRLEDGSTYNGDDDPRVTKIGMFMRKTSIDEIPQFLNVLFGQMSFIGPRPDPLDWLDKYKPEERIFLTVKPGITGYNQAYYRNSANSQEKIDHDVYYAKNISFWMDVKIIFKTIKTVLFRENLYHDETKREFGSAIPLEAVPDNYFQQLEQKFKSHSYLTTGRGALMLVGQSIETDNKHIYIPAYSCESMVKPFKDCGWKVTLYPLNEDLTISQAFVDEMVANTEQRFAILTMNYFGVAGTKLKVEEIKTKRKDIVIIEDFTHCLFTLEEIYSEKIDYYVGSIRKSLGVADGAIVLSNHLLNEAVDVLESSFVTKRLKALKEKDDYIVEKKGVQKENFRQILGEAESEIDEQITTEKMSDVSKKVLDNQAINSEWGGVRYKRNTNLKHLYKLIKDIEGIRFPFPEGTSLDNAYFMLPIMINNRDEIQRQFAQEGLYCQLLWPLSEEARTVCKTAANMEKEMLAIPIDQRYDFDDIEQIGHIIRSVMK